MPGFANSYYKDGKLPTRTKQFFSNHDLLTVHNIILKNILIFFHNLHYSPETLPQSIINLIPANAPTNILDHSSNWYITYNSHPYNKTVFFKGPMLYTDITCTNQEIYLPAITKVTFKKRIKNYLLTIQKTGDREEWESTNFKLNCMTGLRRSKRINEQMNSTQHQ